MSTEEKRPNLHQAETTSQEEQQQSIATTEVNCTYLQHRHQTSTRKLGRQPSQEAISTNVHKRPETLYTSIWND